ncbi:hypothetical protein [Massilia sp. ST3]|uniref:hypothetical protein n=1 Tax=Massilia sp. ST3 TaxID=2824903 RepID=UPI001B81C348|nr:hypothetical protein [Massilia sp. ST3]MBQ5949649.1 hypothetical protein [Massilia sp. ST3]
MRALPALLLGSVMLCGVAGAADTAPARELEPVHVNAMRDPEIRKYKAILAGLDAFDRHHKLAPAVERLEFRATARKPDASPDQLAARLVGDDGFSLALPIDAGGRFVVPRSDAAASAESELELNRKRRAYRVNPDIRTPGLPASQRRLGDLRLECKVTVAIAKEEIPLFWVLAINTVMLTSDWCSFFDEKRQARFGFHADGPVTGAVLREGERSLDLKPKDSSLEVPLGSPEWSDEAVVELSFAETATGTAGETPRTAP